MKANQAQVGVGGRSCRAAQEAKETHSENSMKSARAFDTPNLEFLLEICSVLRSSLEDMDFIVIL